MLGFNRRAIVGLGLSTLVAALGELPGRAIAQTAARSAEQRLRDLGIVLPKVTTNQGAAGSLDNVSRVVKVFGMVNSAPDFIDRPTVINGCSDVFIQVFGDERGKHARSAVGMSTLAFNGVVEIESIFELI